MTVCWLWRIITLIVLGGGGKSAPAKNAITQKCTAAQLQPKVIFFGILCFFYRLFSSKMCILDLEKIQLNCI